MANTNSFSDQSPYGSSSESVDLGQQLDQPRMSDSKTGAKVADSAADLASSASPQSQRHGGADPFMGVETDGTFWPEPGNVDDANAGAWEKADSAGSYTPMYDVKK